MANWQRSLSFPANPTIGQTVDDTGKTYQWNGIGWRQITPSLQGVNPPGFEILAFGSVNNVASLSFTLTSFLSVYRAFTWKLFLLPATDGAGLLARTSTDGGVTYDSAAASYNWAGMSQVDTPAGSVVGLGSGTSIALADLNTIGNGATEGWMGSVELFNPTSAALWARISAQAYYIDNVATPSGRAFIGGGAREAAQDVDGMQFLFGVGNISSGDYALYGWR